VTGGKFANGAATAAFGQTLNGNSEIQRDVDAQKSESDKFMNFMKKQGVERQANEPFIFEKIADDLSDLPDHIRNSEPVSIWGKIVDDMGNHSFNQRLPGGYHLSVDQGAVNLHFDAFDPLNGPISTIQHGIFEVLVHPGPPASIPDVNENWK
jgi:hypothetical protein